MLIIDKILENPYTGYFVVFKLHFWKKQLLGQMSPMKTAGLKMLNTL